MYVYHVIEILSKADFGSKVNEEMKYIHMYIRFTS